MGQSEQGLSLRCRFGIHTWVTRVNAGARWQECGRCGKVQPQSGHGQPFPSLGHGGRRRRRLLARLASSSAADSESAVKPMAAR